MVGVIRFIRYIRFINFYGGTVRPGVYFCHKKNMTEIKITRAAVRKELILLMSHIADVRREPSDDYIRKVAALDDDSALQALISDTQVARILSPLAGLIEFDIDSTGYIFYCLTPPAGLSERAVKRLLTGVIVATIARSWGEMIGWPYNQASENAVTTAVEALTAALTPALTSPAGSLYPKRRLPPL